MRLSANLFRHLRRTLTSMASPRSWLPLATAVDQELVRRTPRYLLRTPRALHPVGLRRGSSDLAVFFQVFVLEEYAALGALPAVESVLDCGANVGYSAAWFLSRFPAARVVALEPDPENFAMLRQNLEPYGDRATTIRGALWSHNTRLAMRDHGYRDGREWTRQVRECAPGEPGGVDGFDMPTLLQRAGFARLSLLKIDIEGAEVVVFAAATGAWLPRVDAIAIELHEDSSFGPAEPVFRRALQGSGFRFRRSGELTICRREGATT